MIISPGSASTTLPSTVIDTVAFCATSLTSVIGAAAVLDVEEELVAEQTEGGHDRLRDRGPELADRLHVGRPLLRRELHARADVVADVLQHVEILHAAVAELDAAHDLVEPRRALAARRA